MNEQYHCTAPISAFSRLESHPVDDDNPLGRAPRAAPIAESLARLIGRQIAEGVYRPGDKLPSLRELAQLHRLSLIHI